MEWKIEGERERETDIDKCLQRERERETEIVKCLQREREKKERSSSYHREIERERDRRERSIIGRAVEENRDCVF